MVDLLQKRFLLFVAALCLVCPSVASLKAQTVPRAKTAPDQENAIHSGPVKPRLDAALFHSIRGGLKNSFLKFENQKAGRVAFLGGSITENPGWREKICAYLQERFPDTRFDFIQAGIGSTGSTPGAFRLYNDVLSKGPVDLLFEEAAVNDHYNGFDDKANLRGMEGIVRHARITDPMMDIVLMYFVDLDKIADYDKGVIPAVIRVHDSVASRYNLPSINLAKEVTDRINAGEFTWKDDFKDAHPSPFGEDIYYRSIRKLLEDCWASLDTHSGPEAQPLPEAHPLPKAHPLPAPLDTFSYVNGAYVDIHEARVIGNWHFDEHWEPRDGMPTRKGYVDVPMLIGETPGAELSFAFKGTAVGICVAAGQDAGVIEYSVDGAPYREQDLYTGASKMLHIPWYYVLESELSDGSHVLRIRISGDKNKESNGNACRIVHFLVNGTSLLSEALNQPWGNLFRISRTDGKYAMGDTLSQYGNNHDFKYLFFDISNNKVLANMGVQGSVKNISMFRDAYFANCGPQPGIPGGWPGVWAAKDNSSFGPYSFSLRVDGAKYDLDTVNWNFKTGLLDNLFPITEFTAPGARYKISVIAYAPMSSDGAERIRGLVYGLLLENNDAAPLKGTVYLPELFVGDRHHFNEAKTAWSQFDPLEYELALGDAAVSKDSVGFNLGKGEAVWVPAVFSMLGDSAVKEINAKGTLTCLDETRRYFRKMMGILQIPGNPYLAEFYERQVMGAFGSIAMSAGGKIAGSSFGSYPTTRQIWLKDCFYSTLPFMQLDPLLAQKLIEWFREFGVRPPGTTQPGGVNHSVGLSVSSIILASRYYRSTGDKLFFTRHPTFKAYWDTLMKQLISSRQDTSVWLFPSRFISDGPIEADYHTGSNVCAWAALKGYAGLLAEVYNDSGTAKQYGAMADKVHDEIMRRCTVDGPYGRQFVEGTYRDGRKPPMVSDGEESDITLMPFYGFVPYDDPTYLNYMKFSVSANNAIYEPALYAISWFGVPSTAPGYLKGLCAGTNAAELFGAHGYYTEVRKVTDADGSIWWWSYGWASKEMDGFTKPPKVPPYGAVVRGVPGKSGWFAGIHSALFVSRFLGLSYDAITGRVCFAPMGAIGDFSFDDFPMGDQRFSIAYERVTGKVRVRFKNSNNTAKSLEVLLPAGNRARVRVTADGKPVANVSGQVYLGSPVVQFNIGVPADSSVELEVAK